MSTETIYINATDSGGDGRATEFDPIAARTVWVRAQADHQIDELVRILPVELVFSARIDPLTCSVASPDFINLGVQVVIAHVEEILRDLTTILHLYTPNSPRPYQVWQVHDQLASGRQVATRKFELNVLPWDGIAKLSERTDIENLTTRLLRLADADEVVRDALGLLWMAEPPWGAVYDVLEFMEKTAVSDCRHTKKFKKHMRTANFHRHRGISRLQLPNDPPTLAQARSFAFDLLRKWMEERVGRHSG